MENNFTNKLNQDDVVFFQEKDNHLFTKTFKISDFMSWMLKNLERVMNTQKQR